MVVQAAKSQRQGDLGLGPVVNQASDLGRKWLGFEIQQHHRGSFNDLTGGDILRCVNTPAEVGAGLCDIDIGILDLIERANRS